MIRGPKTVAASAIALALWWGVAPLLSYQRGTLTDVNSTVLSEPFLDGDTLKFERRGHVARSCPVELRRTMIDADQVVTRLTPVSRPAMPVGPFVSPQSVPVPLRIAEGEARYLVTEVPACTLLQRVFPIEIVYPEVVFTVTR